MGAKKEANKNKTGTNFYLIFTLPLCIPAIAFLFPELIFFIFQKNNLPELLLMRTEQTSFPDRALALYVAAPVALLCFFIFSIWHEIALIPENKGFYDSTWRAKELKERARNLFGLAAIMIGMLLGMYFLPMDFNFCKGCVSGSPFLFLPLNIIFLFTIEMMCYGLASYVTSIANRLAKAFMKMQE